jgi:hypothetical protein
MSVMQKTLGLDHCKYQDRLTSYSFICMFYDIQFHFIIILFIEGDQFKLFFLLQVINNACATQAVLSVLMNINSPDVQLGPTLQVNYHITWCIQFPWIIIHLNS